MVEFVEHALPTCLFGLFVGYGLRWTLGPAMNRPFAFDWISVALVSAFSFKDLRDHAGFPYRFDFAAEFLPYWGGVALAAAISILLATGFPRKILGYFWPAIDRADDYRRESNGG